MPTSGESKPTESIPVPTSGGSQPTEGGSSPSASATPSPNMAGSNKPVFAAIVGALMGLVALI